MFFKQFLKIHQKSSVMFYTAPPIFIFEKNCKKVLVYYQHEFFKLIYTVIV